MAGEISLGARNSSSEAWRPSPFWRQRRAVFFFLHFACFAATLIRSWVFEELGTKGTTELIKLNDLL